MPCQVTQVFQMQLLVIQFTFKTYCFTNRCIYITCVTWQGIDYKLPEDDTIVPKHVGV